MSTLLKRLLKLETAPAPAPSSAPAPDADAIDARQLGLRDAVLSGWFQAETGELFTGFPVTAEDVVLDAGCGEGGIAAFCARAGAHVIGVDVHPETLEAARKRLEGAGARALELHRASADDLPVADAMASRVICTEVLEHVQAPAKILAELVRVGRPGALYLFSVPDALTESLMKVTAPDSYFQSPNHLRIFQRDEFTSLIRDAGLEVLSYSTDGFYWAIWWNLFWVCHTELSNPRHPILDNWTATWKALLDTDGGLELKRHLDSFMPRTQVIVARKPS